MHAGQFGLAVQCCLMQLSQYRKCRHGRTTQLRWACIWGQQAGCERETVGGRGESAPNSCASERSMRSGPWRHPLRPHAPRGTACTAAHPAARGTCPPGAGSAGAAPRAPGMGGARGGQHGQAVGAGCEQQQAGAPAAAVAAARDCKRGKWASQTGMPRPSRTCIAVNSCRFLSCSCCVSSFTRCTCASRSCSAARSCRLALLQGSRGEGAVGSASRARHGCPFKGKHTSASFLHV